MELSVFIAQILGLVYVSFGLGLLINGDYYKKVIDDMLKNTGFMIYGGMMALVFGFLIVKHHNLWVQDWRVLITLLGWIGLIKGVLLFVAPKALLDFSKPLLKDMNVLGVGVLIMGSVIGYFGFFA